MASRILTNCPACNGSGGFYGISVAETDGLPSFRGINKLNFNSVSFYIEQNTPNTDEVIINFRGSTSGGSSGVTDHGDLTGLADDDHPQYLLKSEAAFYGITVAETDGTGAYRNINTLKFFANDFYLTQNSPNTDEAIVNLRNRLTKINESSGTINVQAPIRPDVTATHDIGNNVARFKNVFASRVVAKSVNSGNVADVYTGGSILGASAAAARSAAGLQTEQAGSLATGYAVSNGNNGLALIRAQQRGATAIGYARAQTGYAYVRSVNFASISLGGATGFSTGTTGLRSGGIGAIAMGYANNLGTNSSVINAAGTGSFAQGYCFGFSSNASSILANTHGAFAQGFAYAGTIQALALGSAARGSGRSAGQITVTLGATGAFASGFANAGTISIGSSGLGAHAFGYAASGQTINANAANAFQFGPGTNTTALSLQTGSTIRLLGTPGRIEATTLRLSDVAQADAFYLNKGGETANTASNLGAGSGIFAQKISDDLQFKSLTAGTGITLTPSATEIQVSASSDPGFYGITISDTIGNPSYRGISTLKFLSSDFYVSQNTPNTDTAIVNLRHRLTLLNDSDGVVTTSGSIVPSSTATLNLGSKQRNFNKVIGRQATFITGSADGYLNTGGNVFGTTSKVAGTARIEATGATPRGAVAFGYAKTAGYANAATISRIRASGKGSLATGITYAYASQGSAYITALSDGSVAIGNSNSIYGNCFVEAFGNACFAQGRASSITSNAISRIRASSYGSFARGNASAGITSAYILSSGNGAFAMGYANSGTIQATQTGTVALGSVQRSVTTGGGTIEATAVGAFAQGRTNTTSTGVARIRASGAGSMSTGYARAASSTGSYLTASGSGSRVAGYTSGGTIQATGLGCQAGGSVASGNSITAGSGTGATALGFASANSITASGNGSLAIGAVAAGQSAISATAANSFQFGPGTNSTTFSLQVGEGQVRLNGSTGEVMMAGDLNHDGSRIGFFYAPPVTRRQDIFYLMVNFTATTDAVLDDVGVAFNQATLNNNFAELATKINRLREALREYGLLGKKP